MANIQSQSPISDSATGAELAGMFDAATNLLEQHVEEINALNVFPVPDGDTGTNMFLTMQSGVQEVNNTQADSVSEVATAMYRGTFMGARGNSGVILSQFLRGLADGFDGLETFSIKDIVTAYERARQCAYQSVGKPVEGTMLTVIASIAESAKSIELCGGNLNDLHEAVCTAARDSVAETPTLLSTLREAGVVDAGGQGLAVILEGLRRYAIGQEVEGLKLEMIEPSSLESADGVVSEEFLSEHEEDEYGYCTQFVIEGDSLDLKQIRSQLDEMARSTVVVGDEFAIMVHAHADDPGNLISMGVSNGQLSKVKVENMDVQHTEFTAARRDKGETFNSSVVAVAAGTGISDIFRELGVSQLIVGGDTMNPSVGEIVSAIAKAPSETVFVLPNNKNIVPAAKAAAEQSPKIVNVLDTLTIPQGISAMFSFDVEADVDTNRAAMSSAMTGTTSAAITVAMRDATIEGISTKEGQYIGLLEGDLVIVGDDIKELTLGLLSKAGVDDGSLVTLYQGDELSEKSADAIGEAVIDAYQGSEIEVVQGGQPHYRLIISIE